MSTAIEDAMRFRPSVAGGKVFFDTRGARNALGYRVRLVRAGAPYAIRRGRGRPSRQFDVYGPKGWLGVEPDIYWAMKRADADYFDARKRAQSRPGYESTGGPVTAYEKVGA